MEIRSNDNWLDDFVTSASVRRAGTRGAFYRALREGRFVTLATGVHLPAHTWQRLDTDARFRARVHAAARAGSGELVFSHLSAAALWRLPMVGSWPAKPEVTVEPAGGGAGRASYRAHTVGLPADVDRIDRVPITKLPRTVVDVARVAPLGTAVAIADAALSKQMAHVPHRAGAYVTPDELTNELIRIPAKSGLAKCRRVLELADGAAGSPGESVSRVAMHLEGLPKPVLQQEFRDRGGLIGVVDFWWPEFQLIGEFDGLGKYTREDMLGGRSPADAVIVEKRREDRLRALGPRVVRWGWEAAISPPRLQRVLRDAGLR